MNAKIWSCKSGSREEIAPLEQLAHQNTEPDFHLIHPGSVFGRVGKHYLVNWVVQKCRRLSIEMNNNYLPSQLMPVSLFWCDVYNVFRGYKLFSRLSYMIL
jgi:hypothetical protein